jgi:GTP cyclohydrolase II
MADEINTGIQALLVEPCGKEISREDLDIKMGGKPDFIPEEYYCKGRGTYCQDNEICVQYVAKADFPTEFGHFTLHGFFDNREGKEHTAVVRGDIADKEDCPLRIHSECHTGDIWGSLRCDCQKQLHESLRYIAERPFGAVIYLKQEGRGIGLLNKIKAYQLQDRGLDTVEANQYLGFPADARDYKVAGKILDLLQVKSVALLTNNPEKIEGLQAEGVDVVRRIPIVIPTNPFNKKYLETKKNRMGHLF